MRYPILDLDLNLLQELIYIIDLHLDKIRQEAAQVDDPDSLGYFDSGEHITGLGFIACQTYMSSVCGHLSIKKHKALSVGPLHSSGQTKVQIINHAANYWKHNNEWSLNKNNKRIKYVEDAFKSVGFPINTDYPLSGILTELALPEHAAFKSIITILELWRDELYKTAA